MKLTEISKKVYGFCKGFRDAYITIKEETERYRIEKIYNCKKENDSIDVKVDDLLNSYNIMPRKNVEEYMRRKHLNQKL